MLEVGQKLWFVGSHRYNEGGREVTVEKVGRKWAKLNWDGHRIDVETLWADGGQYISPGRAWPSEDAYMREQERIRLWREFQKRLCHTPPDGVSIETIRQVSNLLGIDLG